MFKVLPCHCHTRICYGIYLGNLKCLYSIQRHSSYQLILIAYAKKKDLLQVTTFMAIKLKLGPGVE
jgi:hypothetical protein